MSQMVTSIHNVSAIATNLREINGTWRRAIDLTLANGETVTLVLYADGNLIEQLRMNEQPVEYVQIEDYSPRVERSDKPFANGASLEGDAR